MVSQRIAAGAAVVGAGALAKAYQMVTTSKHDRMLKKSYKAASRAVSDDATVTAEHGVGNDDVGNRDLNVDGHPDLVVKGYSATNIIAEIETEDVVDENPAHIIDQLDRYSRQGYKRVLVVPSSAVDAATELCQEIDGQITVATPGKVGELV